MPNPKAPNLLILEVNFAANTLMLLDLYRSGSISIDDLLCKIEAEQRLGVKYLRAKADGEYALLWHELKDRESSASAADASNSSEAL